MLYNFLSNAIKFTGVGGRVMLRARVQEENNLRIEIEDNGIGIAEADQQKLFTQFQQIRSGYAKPHQGTGLGLAPPCRVARGMDGCAQRAGCGQRTFYLVLPPRPLDAVPQA